MARKKSKPGPPPRSCLTCQKKRKKCDLGRPSCERCLKGGFKCLGYNGDNHENTQQVNINSNIPPTSVTIPMLGAESTRSDAVNRDSRQPPTRLPPDNRRHVDRNQPALPIFGSALIYNIARTVSEDIDNQVIDDYNRSWPQDQIQLNTYGHARSRRALTTTEHPQTVSGTRFGEDYLRTVVQALYTSIPLSIDTTQATREGHFEQIIYEFQLQRASYWLMSLPVPVTSSILQRPKSIIWVLYLGARLFQALGGNVHSIIVSRCIDWIDTLEQKLGLDRLSTSSPYDAAGRLGAQLGLVFLKFTAIGNSSGYLALKKALSAFLHLVAIDSNLHVEHPGGNLVTSLPRTLGVSQYELQSFVLYDSIASLLLGTPPLVEYGYDGECDPTSHSLEWVHGIPVTFIEIVSQVNSWRAGSRTVSLDDWRKLEMRALDWQLGLVVEGKASDNLKVKLAIQEGWRHVALIYIYMGMCGVSSQDARVQESIRQIIQLGEATDNLPIGVHILPHCVIMGLAAKYEKHRAIIHKKLLSFKGTRVWLFHGLEFGRVLEHLWYGVGAGGAPVTWDDYIQSRRAVVPL